MDWTERRSLMIIIHIMNEKRPPKIKKYKMSEKTMKIAKKWREAKIKEDKNLRKELKNFRELLEDTLKSNITTSYVDIGYVNVHGKTKEDFQKTTELRRKFQSRFSMLEDASGQIVTDSKKDKRKMERSALLFIPSWKAIGIPTERRQSTEESVMF